ncbi:MAG: TRL-like family protein [Candidatus Omnitrophica bacterium]|nr:TRL-like family protein [Candidatus Omnitrophota bacterium]
MKRLLGLLLVVLFVSGCATPYPCGMLYTEVGFPVAAGEGARGSKVGTAKSTSILGLVATGDASLKAAMDSAGITKVKHVDYNAKNILGIYGEYTTTVYGD